MVEITFGNGTVCLADRVFSVLFPHDDNGDKTYFVAQIQGHRRRLIPEDVAQINVLF